MTEKINFDIVICLDMKWAEGKATEELFTMTAETYREIGQELKKVNTVYGNVRVKVVAFGNDRSGRFTIKESDFFKYPIANGSYKQFLESMRDFYAEGSVGATYGVNTVFETAVRSAWEKEAPNQRQVIFLLTDNALIVKKEQVAKLKQFWDKKAVIANPSGGEGRRICVCTPGANDWFYYPDFDDTIFFSRLCKDSIFYRNLAQLLIGYETEDEKVNATDEEPERTDLYRSYGYFLDFVVCIDKSYSMKNKLEEAKKNIIEFISMTIERAEEVGINIDRLRIKVIAFGEYINEISPMLESRFFVIPKEKKQLEAFMNSVVTSDKKEGNYRNAREALALAINSRWSTREMAARIRQTILMISDSGEEERAEMGYPGYPENYPKKLEELGELWAGCGSVKFGLTGEQYTYERQDGRLVAFVPNAYPWDAMQSWKRYWPEFSEKAASVWNEEAIFCIGDLLWGS